MGSGSELIKGFISNVRNWWLIDLPGNIDRRRKGRQYITLLVLIWIEPRDTRGPPGLLYNSTLRLLSCLVVLDWVEARAMIVHTPIRWETAARGHLRLEISIICQQESLDHPYMRIVLQLDTGVKNKSQHPYWSNLSYPYLIIYVFFSYTSPRSSKLRLLLL